VRTAVREALKSYEFPKSSRIKILPVANKTSGQVFNYSYRVSIPRIITGRERVQRQFRSKEDAEKFAKDAYGISKKHGESGFELTSDQLLEAKKAFRELEGTGLSLTQAVEFSIPRLQPRSGTRTVEEIVGEFLKTKESKGFRESGMRDLRNRLMTFCELFGHRKILEIDTNEIKSWIESMPLSPRSRLNYLRRVKQIFIWAKDMMYIHDNPLAGLKKERVVDIVGKEDGKPPAIYSIAESRMLLSGTLESKHERLLPVFVLGFFCGLRASELLSANWEDIVMDTKDAYIAVGSDKAKSRIHRNVDIAKNAIDWLSQCDPKSGPIFEWSRSAYDRMRRSLHAHVGVELKANGLRHSFGSYLYAFNGDEVATAFQLGHDPNDHVLFSNYRHLVLKREASRYWSIRPPKNNSKIIRIAR